MHSETIEYPMADMLCKGVAYFEEHGSASRPGVLVLPDAYGMTAFAHEQAQRVAALGYVALVADLYGDGRRVETIEEAGARAGALTSEPERLRVTAQAGMDCLRRHARVNPRSIAAIGFCLGGAVALSLARTGYECAAVATFHGLLKTRAPASEGAVKSRILVNTGVDDPLVPLDDVTAFQQEMSRAGADCQVVMHTGAGHSFTRRDGVKRPGFGYNALADERSWRITMAFLDASFHAEPPA